MNVIKHYKTYLFAEVLVSNLRKPSTESWDDPQGFFLVGKHQTDKTYYNLQQWKWILSISQYKISQYKYV